MTRLSMTAFVVFVLVSAGALLASRARTADLPIPPRTLAIGVTPLQDARSILPPGAWSIDVTMTRERPRAESHRAFVRRVLSPRGPKERLE